MKKTALTLLLCLCLILPVFASCGRGTEPADTVPATEPASDAAASESETAEATTLEATTDKWEEIVPKITMISQRDRTLKIEYSVGGSAEKWSRNDVYLKGPDSVEDGVTPLIQQMVYERNKAAEALFDLTIVYEEWDLGFGKQQEPIELAVKGNDANAPDLFVNMLNDVSKAMMNGVFKDVWSIPNAYFDFDSEGWLKEWMENLSFTGDRAYVLGSDYFLDILRVMDVLPFNMTLMDETATKLAPAIIGTDETLGVGEELSTRFFDLVEEGKWTWDVLGKLSEAAWVDSDGDGQDSIYDVLGIISDAYGGINAASFVYCSGGQLTEAYVIEDESSEYYGKQWIKFADDSTALNRIYEAVKNVFEGPGSLTTSYTFAGNTPENPGASYHHTKFAMGELLFAGICTLGALEDDVFQEMRDLYSVVPCPKLDESGEYNTIIINQGDVGVINVNANPRKARVLSAFIQYCTENSSEIREQFLQIVTKYKTTTYNQGTDRMLEIIYKGVLYGRDKQVDDLNADPRWHRIMMEGRFVYGSDTITQRYQSALSNKQKLLDNVMKTWYTLPKTEGAAN
ncbi:MAG: hypothetical protein IKX66_04500 [Clostridia bacterium]|nr:hypothetical protein [Clostridia bacterium]